MVKQTNYRLFFVIGDADSIKAKSELHRAGISASLHPVDKNDRIRLDRDFGIAMFPALFSDRACFTGLAAIRYFIEKRTKGRASPGVG